MNSMAQVFSGLCEENSMPDCITIILNGTTTVLMKQKAEEGEGMFYVGTPSFRGQNGKIKRGEHPLVVSPDGNIEGTYALNVIINGGWIRGVSKDPGEDARKELRRSITNNVITAAVMANHGLDKEETSLETAIKSETGFDVVKKKMSREERQLIGALGFKFHLIELLDRRGWGLNITPEALISRVNKYCEVAEGSWTEEATKIATTSAMSWAATEYLRNCGYTLRKVRRRTRRSANNG